MDSQPHRSDTNKTNGPAEFLLTNVTLEVGFERDENDQVVGTQTARFDVQVANGKITEITPAGSTDTTDQPTTDAQQFLMLPALQDRHIHIDKTYYGGPWHAAPREGLTVKDMIRREEKLIPELLPDSERKAEACIQLLQSQGTTLARCQCNVDPVSGLESLEHLRAALDKYRDSFDREIVAFPQHGILYSHSEGLLREAAQADVDFIGGLDPTAVDGNMKKSLDVMFDIASEYGKGVDIHLHEGLHTGKAAMEYMIERVRENPALRGKTFISHAYALALMEEKEMKALAEQFVEYGIGIVSSIPIGKEMLPIPTLNQCGVKLMTGTDSLIDHWMPFGSGDMMEKANRCAQLYEWTDEYRLNRALRIATDDVLPLDDSGTRVWPSPEATASFVLVDASCSAEAVARLPRREAVFYEGKQIV